MQPLTRVQPELAHYYGDFIWDVEQTNWVKSLLLFFDGIALALPAANAAQLIDADPVLAQPLAELNLLRNYEPSSWLKTEVLTCQESKSSLERIASIFESIPEGRSPSSAEALEIDAAFEAMYGKEVMESFSRRLRRAQDTFGAMRSNNRSVAVGMTSLLLQENIKDATIQPVIESQNAAGYVAALIGGHDSGRARIMAGDLIHVGVDLDTVPLDEVLAFRREHGAEYRAYSQNVRRFTLDLSLMSDSERTSTLIERRAALDDQAAELTRVGRSAFIRQSVGLGFSVAGAAWTLVHGDPWGAVFAAGAAAAGLSAAPSGDFGAAYTYVLRARTELSH
jgi:AcrR family transcriptional regulator